MRVEGKTDGNQSPQGREPFGGGEAVSISGIAFDDMTVKIYGRARTERVQFGGFGRERGREKRRHQQTDNAMRQLMEDEGNEHVIRVVGRYVRMGGSQRRRRVFPHLLAVLMAGRSGREGNSGRTAISIMPGLQPSFKLLPCLGMR